MDWRFFIFRSVPVSSHCVWLFIVFEGTSPVFTDEKLISRSVLAIAKGHFLRRIIDHFYEMNPWNSYRVFHLLQVWGINFSNAIEKPH